MRLWTLVVVFGLLAGESGAGDWPGWRGPNRDAISKERGLLQSWPAEGPRVKWKSEALGNGYASVVVSNGLLHTIGSESGTIFAYGMEAQTGKILWKTSSKDKLNPSMRVYNRKSVAI